MLGGVVLGTLECDYGMFSHDLDLFFASSPYGVPIADNFVGNTLKITRNRIKVDGSRVPRNTHGVTNE